MAKIKAAIVSKKKREGIKTFSIEETLDNIKQSGFSVYMPYGLDDLENTEDYYGEDGEILVDKVPDDNLLEINCKYLDGFELSQIYDPPKTLNMTKEQLKDFIETDEDGLDFIYDQVKTQTEATKTDSQTLAEICRVSIISHVFESAEHVAQIIPMEVQQIIRDNALELVDNAPFAIKG